MLKRSSCSFSVAVRFPEAPGLSRLGDAVGTDVDDAIDDDDNYDYPDADGEYGGDGDDDCVGSG